MNFYDVLSGQCNSHFERLFAQKMRAGKIQELSGVPPLTFLSDGSALIDYSIYGNGHQSKKPDVASSVPASPDFCGNVIDDKYVIPITVAEQTYVVYLTSPLAGIGTFSDIIEYSTQTATRRIKKVVVDGTESFGKVENASTPRKSYFYISSSKFRTMYNAGYKISFISDCFTFVNNLSELTETDSSAFLSGSNLYFYASIYASFTAQQVKQFSTNRYADGIPYSFWYATTNPTIESIELPQILTAKGENTLTVDTTLQPSNVYLKYKGA